MKNEHKTLPFKPKKNDKVLILAPFDDQVESMSRSISSELADKKENKESPNNGYEFCEKSHLQIKGMDSIDESDFVITGSYIVKNDPAVNDGVIDDSIQDSSKWATAFLERS